MISDLYRRWLLELWNGDFDLAHQIVTPGFAGHWPGQEVSGPEGLIEALRQAHEPFDDISDAQTFMRQLGIG